MGLLQRHLLASVAAACAAAVGLFGFVLIAGQALRDLLGYVVAGQLDPATAARLLGLLVPFVAVYALPIGLLTGVLLVLGRMSSQHEITAMRAAGLSLRYIARPVWWIAWVGVALSLALNFEIMPRAQTEYRVTLLEAVRQNPLNFIVPKTFVRDFDGFVVYVNERKGSELKDFWLWKLDTQKRVTGLVRARRATIALREADDRLVLTLFEASAETRARLDPEDFSKPQPIGNSDSLTVELPLDGVFRQIQAGQKIMFMTFDELRARRTALLAKGAAASDTERRDLTRIAVTLSSRAAGSFVVLAFAVIAVPLGIKVSRKETSANLGIAVALVLGYYFLDALARMLERSPALHPEIWVWLPPLLYAVVGGWLFQRVDRA
jgi:lipopolysaccharide export system permease protein